jgi:hypothetical protein
MCTVLIGAQQTKTYSVYPTSLSDVNKRGAFASIFLHGFAGMKA